MFQLCEITNKDSLYYNITVEEGETLLKSFFFLGVNMNSHYLYQIAKRNLKDLLEFITQQQNKLDNIDTLECNRLLYNYVDTFYSFVNYSGIVNSAFHGAKNYHRCNDCDNDSYILYFYGF